MPPANRFLANLSKRCADAHVWVHIPSPRWSDRCMLKGCLFTHETSLGRSPICHWCIRTACQLPFQGLKIPPRCLGQPFLPNCPSTSMAKEYAAPNPQIFVCRFSWGEGDWCSGYRMVDQRWLPSWHYEWRAARWYVQARLHPDLSFTGCGDGSIGRYSMI